MSIPCTSPCRTEPVSAIILAGGRAQRLGGGDKGLLRLGDRPLIEHVLARLAPQVDDIVISANRNLDVYAGYAWPVVADAAADFAGPLAGVLAGAGRARHDWLLVAPCDTPFLPECLAAAMLARARAVGVSLVRAAAPDRTHYAIMLLHRRLLPDLDRWLAGGARRVQAWQDGHGHADALFEQPPWAFLNINTEADLHRAEAYLTV